MPPIFRLLQIPPLKPSLRMNRALRLVGLALLALATWLAHLLVNWRHAIPLHGANAAEVALSLLAVLLFWAGNVLLVAGDRLLRPVPRPPRPLQ